ncbi:hypothetical protein PHET_10745 [Paragonimus heterotremus]|uniref:Ig-like domain-containing protein n=1 Tax=Paragonimus heterotremus TaxID=100268 RepID=A0A8J4SL71_9TREM|nr:hypothetical protein PHET_10745 [Paragonimus heterotremus]
MDVISCDEWASAPPAILTDSRSIDIKWLRDGEELSASEKFELVPLDDVGFTRLKVLDAGPEDSGEYTCVVKCFGLLHDARPLAARTVSSSSNVVIEKTTVDVEQPVESAAVVPEQQPKLDFAKQLVPEFRKVSESQTDLLLECRIETDMEPVKVKWLLNAEELTMSDRLETCFAKDTGYISLIIHKVQPLDSGEYTCIVSGTVMESATVRSIEKTIRSTVKIIIEAEADEQVEEVITETVTPESPIFMTELSPVRVCEGEEIYLTAVVKGVPQPLEVVWKHDGIPLQLDTTDAILYYAPESGLCELTISEAFPEDSGIYSVEATNEFGLAITQTEVIVFREEDESSKITPMEEQAEQAVGLETPVEFSSDMTEVQPTIQMTESITETIRPLTIEVMQPKVVQKDQVDSTTTKYPELCSPVEVMPQLPDMAYCEHYVEEKDIYVELEEPSEIPLDEVLEDEGESLSSIAVALDVLIPYDALSIDETSFATEEMERMASIPSLVEITPSQVMYADLTELSEVKAAEIPDQQEIVPAEAEEGEVKKMTEDLTVKKEEKEEKQKYVIEVSAGAQVTKRGKSTDLEVDKALSEVETQNQEIGYPSVELQKQFKVIEEKMQEITSQVQQVEYTVLQEERTQIEKVEDVKIHEFPTEAAAVVPQAVTVPAETGPYLESIVVDEVRSELGRIEPIMEGEFHGPVAIGSAQLEQVVSEASMVEHVIEVRSIEVECAETWTFEVLDGVFSSVGFGDIVGSVSLRVGVESVVDRTLSLALAHKPHGRLFLSDENIVSSHIASSISCVGVLIPDQLSEIVPPSSVEFTDNLLETEVPHIVQQPLAEELQTGKRLIYLTPTVIIWYEAAHPPAIIIPRKLFNI